MGDGDRGLSEAGIINIGCIDFMPQVALYPQHGIGIDKEQDW
jgi:hypothetical protein